MRTVVFFDPYPVVGLGFAQIIKNYRAQIQSRAVSCLDSLAQLAVETTPDMLVLTVNTIKNRNPLVILEQCRKIYPNLPVVLYDEGHYKSHMVKWMKAGVVGYLLKSESESVLLQCIDTILGGRKYLSPEGWAAYFSTNQGRKLKETEKLGKREYEVARHLTDGRSTTWIAAELGSKPSTISTMKKRIFYKLKVNNVVELSRIIHTVRTIQPSAVAGAIN